MTLTTIFFVFANLIICAITMTRREAMEYLVHYGYMTASNESDFQNCLMKFQKAVSIPMTGEMDAKTNKMMEMPRCGCSDKTTRRVKRYSIHGSIWRVNDIKYNVQYPSQIKAIAHKSISRAFDEWSKYSEIRFLEGSPHEALLHISFTSLESTKMIGVAYFPLFGGNISFNKDITWTDRMDSSAVNLYQVALHEIGHSLGLGHSMTEQSVMYPYYDKNVPKMHLVNDDIEGITTLYNKTIIDGA